MPRSQKEALINTINHLIKNEYEDVQQWYRWALVPIFVAVLSSICLSWINTDKGKEVLVLGGGLVPPLFVAIFPCSKAQKHRDNARVLEAALPIVYTLDQPEIEALSRKFLEKIIAI